MEPTKELLEAICKGVYQEMLIINPTEEPSHPTVDWVIENFADEVNFRFAKWFDLHDNIPRPDLLGSYLDDVLNFWKHQTFKS